MTKRTEEATRRTVEEAKRFVEEANRRAEEANRRAEEVIREAKEAKESFVTELERRRLEEENRAKEMEEQASKAIAAAQARSQAAEQQTLAASKMAEEKIQNATKEASKLQEAFMETMKQFNTTTSIRKTRINSLDSGSENEVLDSLSRIPDDDEQMSLATLPPGSLESEEQSREGGSNFRDTTREESHMFSKVGFQVLRVFNIC